MRWRARHERLPGKGVPGVPGQRCGGGDRGLHRGAGRLSWGLLWSARKGGKFNTGAGMSDEAVAVILKRCAAKAEVQKLSPHDLRRSFVTDLLLGAVGGPISPRWQRWRATHG